VLVVDDDPDIRDLVGAILEDEGYAVAAAGDGAEGLAAVERERPSVILSDMRMPGVNGWDFAREYRRRHDGEAKIVCMTAAQNAAGWCREIAADAALPKPFELGTLYAVVDRLTGRAA
jgi:CheY-like chemotaxis protein